MIDWQDISTAPRDGTRILILVADDYVVEGFWRDDIEDFYKSQKGWGSFDPENKMGTWVSYGLIAGDDQGRLFCGQTPKYWMPKPPLPPRPESNPMTTPNTVIERVARAIAVAGECPQSEQPCGIPCVCRTEARAAIRATLRAIRGQPKPQSYQQAIETSHARDMVDVQMCLNFYHTIIDQLIKEIDDDGSRP